MVPTKTRKLTLKQQQQQQQQLLLLPLLVLVTPQLRRVRLISLGSGRECEHGPETERYRLRARVNQKVQG